jgi:hypothetical protein
MLSTYKAVLTNNQLQWLDEVPAQLNHLTVFVYVTVLQPPVVNKPELPGQPMVAILQKIADQGGPGIDDPVTWQRDMRQDRSLPGRTD